MKVHVGSILHAYTGGRDTVTASGRTVGGVLNDLERQFPGLRFRVVDEQDQLRPHIAVFVANVQTRDLGCRLEPGAEIHIFGALSGG